SRPHNSHQGERQGLLYKLDHAATRALGLLVDAASPSPVPFPRVRSISLPSLLSVTKGVSIPPITGTTTFTFRMPLCLTFLFDGKEKKKSQHRCSREKEVLARTSNHDEVDVIRVNLKAVFLCC